MLKLQSAAATAAAAVETASARLSMTAAATKTLWNGVFRRAAQVSQAMENEPLKSPSGAATEHTPLLRFQATVAPNAAATDGLPSLADCHRSAAAARSIEVRALTRLAFQMLVFGVVDFAPNFLSGVLTGHLSTTFSSEFMAARSLALIFNMVTGSTLIAAMSAAMDTLCAQAYGAGQLRELGLFFQTGLLVLAAGLLPVILASVYCVELLELAGQERHIAQMVHDLVLLALPGVPFSAINVLLGKVLQGQNRVMPLISTGLVASVVQATLLYTLMFHSSLGVAGSAVAASATMACSTFLLIAYTISSGLYEREWPGWQLREAARLMPEFLRLGVSGMAMFVCEVWGFAMVALSAGWLPHAAAAVSSDSVYANLRWIGALCYAAIGLAGSVRVGNALGANDPARARHAASLAMALSVGCALVASLAMLLSHRVLPFAFTRDERVVALTSRLLLVTSPVQVFAAVSFVAQGVFRGCGLQALGARVNFVCYLLLAVPFGMLLAFPLGMGLVGLWLGLSAGFVASGVFCAYWLARRADWEALAFQAQQRTTLHVPVSEAYMEENCYPEASSSLASMA